MRGIPLRGTPRDFRLFWLAGAADQLGSHASGVVMPILVLAIGGDAFSAGLVGTVTAVAHFAFAPFAGVYADRYSRQRLLIGCATVNGLATALITVAVATGAASIPMLIVAGAVGGIASSIYGAAGSGAIRRVLPPDNPEKAVAAIQARSTAAGMLGPSIGGGLYTLTAWAPFLFDAISYFIAAVLIGKVRTGLGPERDAEVTRRPSVRAEFVAGLRFVWSQPFLRFVVLWAAGVNLAVTALYFYVIFVAAQRGASAGSIGVIAAIASGAGLLGALAAPWVIRTLTPPRLVVVMSWLVVVVVVPVTLARSSWQLGAILALVSFVSPPLSVVLQTRAIVLIPDGMQGRVGTALGTLSEGAAALAPLLAGILIAVASASVVALVFTAALAALAFYSTANRFHLRPAPPQEDNDPDATRELAKIGG